MAEMATVGVAGYHERTVQVELLWVQEQLKRFRREADGDGDSEGEEGERHNGTVGTDQERRRQSQGSLFVTRGGTTSVRGSRRLKEESRCRGEVDRRRCHTAPRGSQGGRKQGRRRRG
jgi:hypothetical protein